MRRILKWVGIVVLAIIAVVGCFAAYVAIDGIPKYDIQTVNFKAEYTPERFARGKHLASSLCVDCHKDPATGAVSGKEIVDLPPPFGKAWSRNITQHKTKGIGNWTDGQIAYSLRTGISSADGRYLPPWMPKFAHMSDEDMKSIIVWLRSDDPVVAATDVDNRVSEPTFLVKFLAHVAFKPLPYPTAPIAVVDSNNTIAYGKYLATGVYDCYSCHSGDFKTMDAMQPEKSGDFFAGGNQMPDANMQIVTTPNLTMDKATGLGAWTKEQFVTAIRTGFRHDGTLLRYPMPRGNNMTEHELACIYDYLQTVPKISKPQGTVETFQVAASASKGEKAFVKYNCIRCHSATGHGIADLQLANKKFASDSLLADVILHASNYYPETSMPTWDGHIASEDVPHLVAHVRHLGKASGR